MPDPAGEARPINYSQEDRNARLLWTTQIPKANPWEHRTKDQQDEASSKEDSAPDSAPAEVEKRRKTISQTDKLSLHREETLENPFERLLEHRLHIELSSHESQDQ